MEGRKANKMYAYVTMSGDYCRQRGLNPTMDPLSNHVELFHRDAGVFN